MSLLNAQLVVPFLRWYFGFGFLGEHAGIHPYFNTLAHAYNSVRQPEQKLLLMLKEHMLHLAPVGIAENRAIVLWSAHKNGTLTASSREKGDPRRSEPGERG